jgi:CheY-like chemotaxis protein
VLPDEEKAGTLLIKQLIKEAADLAESSIRVLAIEGDPGERLEPSTDLKGMRVLVVDDNASSREILQALLEDMSFEVSVAASAAEGVAELEKEAKGRPYQLVFMDNQMPEMGGFEATRLIREWERGMGKSACDEQFGPELTAEGLSRVECGMRK